MADEIRLAAARGRVEAYAAVRAAHRLELRGAPYNAPRRSGVKPTVGLPTVPGAGCAYSADLDSPACGAPPTTHLMVVTAGWGLVALDTCDDHVGIAWLAGDVLAQHPFRPECATTDCWGSR